MLQQAKSKFLSPKLEATRKSWKAKTASINLERDSQKVWKLVKEMNVKGSDRGSTTLKEKGNLLTCKQAANTLADNYEDVSNIPINKG